MTSRVSCAEAALQMVSDGPGPLETITRGKSAVKTAAMTATIPSALSPNARPSQPARTSAPAAAKASPQTAARTIGTVPPRAPGPCDPPAASHAAVPTTSAPARGETHIATLRARSASGPAVLSARNVAPWARNIATLASPPTIATGASRPQKLPW